ncbi:DUF2254 domain-containing protein [Rubellimicrobium roseum]|uniref:DUF2254 domain-containing protein n=1 Tax=Rubellimicrobium roseum TaxID=687525 RepID=A0A5C4N8E8_9RHOB|nr:DUF2254 domain-containing protein [Rubellimicrobium roseum]
MYRGVQSGAVLCRRYPSSGADGVADPLESSVGRGGPSYRTLGGDRAPVASGPHRHSASRRNPDFFEPARRHACPGIVQAVSPDWLCRFKSEIEIDLRLLSRSGSFLDLGRPLLLVSRHLSDEETAYLRVPFLVGRQRTCAKDLRFALTVLLEKASHLSCSERARNC